MWVAKIKSASGTAALSAFLCGFLTHFFALANVLHNYDDIASQPGGYGTGSISGRWFLEILGQFTLDLGLNYNLPLLNGLIFLLLVAVSAGILISALRITRRSSAAIIGMLFAVFPTASSTLFFRFTAIFYGISLLFSVLAPFLMERYRLGYISAIILIALSLGIYQAYVPMTIGIFVLLLICDCLDGAIKASEIIRRGFCFCAVLAAGFLLYYGITQLVVAATGDALLNYQGIQNMGKIALKDLPMLMWSAFKDVCLLPLQDYCGIAYRQVLKLTYAFLAVTLLLLLLYLLLTRGKGILEKILFFLLCLVFPIAINFIEVMVPCGWIYTLMVYPLVLLPCLPLILLEYISNHDGPWTRYRSILKKATYIVATLLISFYMYYANVNYTALYYENRQVENYVSAIVTQVRMTEGFQLEQEWVLIGDFTDPLLGSMWAEETAYGGNSYALHLINSFSFSDWIENYVGYQIPFADEETVSIFAAMEEVQRMPCYPEYGSIQIIKDTVVIKCQSLTSN